MSTNFPYLVSVDVTVPSGTNVSVPVQLPDLARRKPGTLAAVQVDCPATVDGATAELQFNVSSTPGDYKSRYDEYGALSNFSIGASREVLLNPSKNCAVFPYVRIKLATNATANRTFKVWFRVV